MIKCLAFALLLFSTPCLADIRLPKLISSKMVLQRESEVTIWGWADPGEEVRVSYDWIQEDTLVDTGADGKWELRIKTGKAGGPHSMTLTGKNRIKLQDILFGEVWIASGQSNMEMPLTKVSGTYSGVKDYLKEMAEADYPEIRLFQVGNYSSKEPLDDVKTGISMYGVPTAACEWKSCNSDSVSTFASTAYFFARELHQRLRVPVGIIDASWGGTTIETWMPKAGLKELALDSGLEQAMKLPQNASHKIPSRLYSGMIHPLRKMNVKGVVWYQGEQNASRAKAYQRQFSAMIRHWRKEFRSDFSFFYVQVCPYEYRGVNAAYLREAQLETRSMPKVGMVVTMDIGDLKDVHPKNKQEVGRRLALWALAKEYDQDLVYSGPIYKRGVFKDGKVRLHFNHLGSGLSTQDEMPPRYFEVAGADKIFYPATATIEGHELVVISERVGEPKAVRYAFSSDAVTNFSNKEGLPASPFRTDRW